MPIHYTDGLLVVSVQDSEFYLPLKNILWVRLQTGSGRKTLEVGWMVHNPLVYSYWDVTDGKDETVVVQRFMTDWKALSSLRSSVPPLAPLQED